MTVNSIALAVTSSLCIAGVYVCSVVREYSQQKHWTLVDESTITSTNDPKKRWVLRGPKSRYGFISLSVPVENPWNHHFFYVPEDSEGNRKTDPTKWTGAPISICRWYASPRYQRTIGSLLSYYQGTPVTADHPTDYYKGHYGSH